MIMGIKDVFNQAPTPVEEAFYKQVLDEIESGIMRKGIYAKALADSLGDKGKAESLYIRYRVQSLIEEEKQKARILESELASKRQNEASKKFDDTSHKFIHDWGTDKLNPYLKGVLMVFIPLFLIAILYWII